MESSLKIEFRDGVYHLDGVFDEFASFDALNGKAAPLRMNFQKVTRINSIGLRNFIRFLRDWNGGMYQFIEAPIELIDQVNMVPSLLTAGGIGKVVSCQAPFHCKSCGYDEIQVLTSPEWANGLPRRDCPKCAKKMDINPEEYLHFAQIHK